MEAGLDPTARSHFDGEQILWFDLICNAFTV
jgi:hypothetical protein